MVFFKKRFFMYYVVIHREESSRSISCNLESGVAPGPGAGNIPQSFDLERMLQNLITLDQSDFPISIFFGLLFVLESFPRSLLDVQEREDPPIAISNLQHPTEKHNDKPYALRLTTSGAWDSCVAPVHLSYCEINFLE